MQKLTSQALCGVRALYGEDPRAQERCEALIGRFESRYGRAPQQLVSAPGRTEILGNHTDHNHGRVLAASVTLDTLAAVAQNGTNTVNLYSEGFADPFCVSLDQLAPVKAEEGTTASLIRGVAAFLKEEGVPVAGFDAEVTSTVFRGSGLSSSAAFEVLLCAIFDALFGGWRLEAKHRAALSQKVENRYFGKPCGLMDQMASSVGGLVAIDFGAAEAQVESMKYDFAAKGLRLCVVQAGGDHENLTAEYASIPAEMRAVAQALGGEVLRDIAPEALLKAIPTLKNRVPDRAILRALHFMDEDARVAAAFEALKKDDLGEFLRLVIASGESSWKLLQNVYVAGSENREMALALELSRRMLDGRGAWRIHGGGFGGTILAFVPEDMLAAYQREMNSVFGENACVPLDVRPVGAVCIEL
ncbi:MAG TPA: galactokinase [Candidatus Alectryocaccomicrobium excrementavium]|uniref:Galactokinase n=1 Tax=Candidatus Alectryocaccomicrobium excrementavium TaxID=2840668 RepID=A0A9D1G2W0_9FIRM|nr:galactokinase [Candidatus Alectryocaccomicrobium excrementavium]